jgi:TIR domain
MSPSKETIFTHETPKVFISHVWEDKDFVRRLEGKLKSISVGVWVDHSNIHGGDQISESVSKGLGWCDAFLLIWSDAASKSEWVKQEWSAANSNHKKIIPCLLDGAKLPTLLADKAHIDFRDFDQGMQQLAQTLNLPPDWLSMIQKLSTKMKA